MERAGEGALHRCFAVADGHSSPRVAIYQGDLGYDNDERVIAIIANGVGNSRTAEYSQTADTVRTRCKWLETVRV